MKRNTKKINLHVLFANNNKIEWFCALPGKIINDRNLHKILLVRPYERSANAWLRARKKPTNSQSHTAQARVSE